MRILLLFVIFIQFYFVFSCKNPLRRKQTMEINIAQKLRHRKLGYDLDRPIFKGVFKIFEEECYGSLLCIENFHKK